jgi:hypothetical protein
MRLYRLSIVKDGVRKKLHLDDYGKEMVPHAAQPFAHKEGKKR